MMIPLQNLAPLALLLSVLLTPALHAEEASSLQPAAPESAGEYSFTQAQRVDYFVEDSFSPGALLFVAVGAAYDQQTDFPGAWPQGADGYGRRLASNFGQRAIGNAAQLGVESMLGEDSRHVPTGKRGFLPRASATFLNAFGVRTPSGRRAIPVGQLAGSFAGGFVSRTWHPSGEDGWRNGVTAGAITFGWHIGASMLAEFLPDLKRVFRR